MSSFTASRLARAGSLFAFVVGCFAFAGCGPGKGDVSGTVSFKGAPLKGGQIAFVSTTGGPTFSGTIQEDGTYLIPGVLSGSYKVTVDTEILRHRVGGAPAGSTPGGMGKGSGSGPPPAAAKGGAGGGPTDIVKDAASGKIKSDIPAAAKGQGGPPPDAPAGASYKSGFESMADNEKRYVQIPQSYSSPDSTDITFEAKSGAQKFDIDLKAK